MRVLHRSLVFTFLSAAIITPVARAQSADLMVTKSGPAEASAGANVTYSITLANLGPDDSAGATLDDPIPPGMFFVSLAQNSGPTFTCTTPPSTATINCTIASLGAGLSANFTVVLNINIEAQPGTVFVNIATASATTLDPNEENNSGVAATSTPPPPQSDLGITKSGPSTAGADTDVVYSISVTNGGDPASGVAFSDTLPGTMTFVSFQQTSGPAMSCTPPPVGSGGTFSCNVATFAAGATATFALTGHIPPATASGTTFQNSATVSSTSSDPNQENNASITSLTVSDVDLSVTKTGLAVAPAGDISYTLTVANAGPDAATDVAMSDPLPAGTTFVSITQNSGPAATCSAPTPGTGGAVTCDIALLANAATAQFTLVIDTGSNTSITNTVSVAADSFDRAPANNSSSVTTSVTPIADVAVTKAGPATVSPGSNSTYTVAVRNNGPSDATNVVLTDATPANTTFVSVTQTSGPAFACTTAAGSTTCTAASLLAGASATFSFVFTVSPTATGTISNTATVGSATPDPAPANNSVTATTPIGASITDVAITKVSSGTAFTGGANVTYTITVSNNGPGVASGTTVTDVLPAGTTFVSATPSQGSCAGTTTVTCSLGTLAASASATISLVVTLPTAGPVSNTATVTISNVDSNATNNSSTSTVMIFGANIPTLSPLALALLGFMLAGVAFFTQRLR